MKRSHLLAFVALHLLFYALYYAPRLREDAPYYYEPLRSAFFDHDLNYYDERPYTRLQSRVRQREFVAGPNQGQRPITGGPNNSFDVGTTVLEAPFFLLGHAAARALYAPATGYSAPYLLAMGMGFLATGFAGVVMTYALALSVADAASAAWATALVAWGSFLPAYLYEDTLLSHLPSFAAAALFLLLLRRARGDARAVHLFLLGAAFAWLVMARRQNVPFAIVMAVLLARNGGPIPALHRLAGWIGAGFALFLFPELCLWKIEYGSFLANPGMVPLRARPVLGMILWSDHGGLFSHSPILLFAAAGLAALARRERLWGILLSLAVVFQVLLNALRVEWWPGIGFGNRRSDSCLPALAMGLAALLAAAGPRARRALLALLTALLLWNMAFLPQFYGGERIMDKGRYYFSFASVRNPHAARIRWPFPAPSALPGLLADDAAIVARQSFTLGGSRTAVVALGATAGAALLIAAWSLRPRGLVAAATAAAVLVPLLLSVPLFGILAAQRRVLALYYDPKEPVEVLSIARTGPFRGGVTALALAPGQERRFDTGGFEAQAVEGVLVPGAGDACVEAGTATVTLAADGAAALDFPSDGRHSRAPLPPGTRPEHVVVRPCGATATALYGLSLAAAGSAP